MSWITCKKHLILKCVLIVTTALLQAHLLHSCIEEERLGLLNLKAYFKSYVNPIVEDIPYEMNWSDNGQRYNCCAWERVSCDPSTNRVTELNLSSMVTWNYMRFEKKLWLFNVTLFRPFKKMISLDLSNNGFNGLIDHDGSTRISTLKSLQSLVLDWNNLQTGFVSLSELASLTTLSLDDCYLDESIATLGLSNLTQLRVLKLRHNKLHDSIEGLCASKNYQELDLSYNFFSGRLPSCLYNFTSLQILDLSDNNFIGTIQNQFYNFKSLENLYLSDNFFTGKTSISSLANSSNLKFLFLSNNQLEFQNGDLAWEPSFQLLYLGLSGCSLVNLPKFLFNQACLTVTDLSHNNLIGTFPTWLLTNNSQLAALSLRNNSLTGRFQLPQYSLLFVYFLDISGNNFQGEMPKNIGFMFPFMVYLNVSENRFQGQIPASVGNMTVLKFLDLSHNNFSGELPRQLFSECQLLFLLKLNNNNLEGEILPEHMNLPNLVWLKMSNNLLGGTIKEGLLNSTVSLAYVDIANNRVTGSLPSWIGNLSDLTILVLSKNLLHGQIPIEICKLRLFYLDLSQNKLNGTLPSCHGNFKSLVNLHLEGNSLVGPIPSSFSNYSNLQVLDLRDNQLSGNIPLWISKLSLLRILSLGRNKIHSELPDQICWLRNINILDLSGNRLYGGIPSCIWNMSFGVRKVDAYDWSYWLIRYGSMSEEVGIGVKNQYYDYKGEDLSLMSELNLSFNNLTGVIPPQLGDLNGIRALNLSHNYLNGSIPTSFSNLKKVESLDLSYNKISGIIPPELTELTSLAIFNVSYNNLTGKTPETGQFGTFDQQNYLGNPGLCVSTMDESCDNPINASPSRTKEEEEDHETSIIDWTTFIWSFVMSCVVAFLATVVILSINSQWRRTWFGFVNKFVPWKLL